MGIFLGGFGAAFVETLRTFWDPRPVQAFGLGNVVLGLLVVMDLVSLFAGMKPLRQRAADRHTTMVSLLWRGTDTAVTTGS